MDKKFLEKINNLKTEHKNPKYIKFKFGDLSLRGDTCLDNYKTQIAMYCMNLEVKMLRVYLNTHGDKHIAKENSCLLCGKESDNEKTHRCFDGVYRWNNGWRNKLIK